MKNLYYKLLMLILMISFLVIQVLSPNEETFRAQYKPENYEKIMEITAPDAEGFQLNIIDSLPTGVRIENGKVENIEIWVNKILSQKQRIYIKDHLKNELEIHDNRVGNLTLRLSGRFVLFEGEDWIISRAFTPYSLLFSDKESSLIKVVLPENISMPPKIEVKAEEQ